MSGGRLLTSPPLPVEPLLEWLVDDAEIAGESIGVSPGTVRRWRQGRVTQIARLNADRFACRLGVNPACIWLHDWW